MSKNPGSLCLVGSLRTAPPVSAITAERCPGWRGIRTRRIPITRQVQVCRDSKDDKFLDVALNGEAHAIITGDQDLAVLDPFHGVRIVCPAVFCTLFAAES